jgi:hypothetical protein
VNFLKLQPLLYLSPNPVRASTFKEKVSGCDFVAYKVNVACNLATLAAQAYSSSKLGLE